MFNLYSIVSITLPSISSVFSVISSQMKTSLSLSGNGSSVSPGSLHGCKVVSANEELFCESKGEEMEEANTMHFQSQKDQNEDHFLGL